MHLKRLELVGFKSFAQKTVLDFPTGIVAVVGPNGSGKSNIIDAVRWLLGEREAKNMRSLKAEDLIFSGTPQKSRLSLAQASIVFDNHSRFFPVDYQEVTIRRRVERDGTSQYFINDAEVRLKDVIDFFAQSRLGTKGFTIINQGDSDLFVRALPKDRRAMLEEILGLRQYQLKKHDAELKLKSTKFNMEKVKALIDEIMPHLRMLKRQTAKWDKHADLENESLALERQYFGVKLMEIAAEEERLEPQLKETEIKIKKTAQELSEFQAALKKVESAGAGAGKTATKFETAQKERQKFFDKKSQLQRDLGRAEAKLEMFISQPSAQFDSLELVKLVDEVRETLEDALYETNIKVIKDLLKSLFDKINRMMDAEATPTGFKDERLEINEAKDSILKELKEVEGHLEKLRLLEEDFNLEFRSANESLRQSFEKVSLKKDELIILENQRNKILFEAERINIRKQELANQAHQSGRKLAEFQPLKKPTGSDINAIERQLMKLRAELASIGEIDPALIKEAQETELRHKFLSSQLEDLEKACHDLLALLKELDNKIHNDFTSALKNINEEFHNYFRMMFGGGQAKLNLQAPIVNLKPDEGNEVANPLTSEEKEAVKDEERGIEINISIPRKRINSLEMLSGGEKALVSLAVLFALISVSPPPFLVLDEVDAALDEQNSKRFSQLIENFSQKTQFLVVTHNRTTMEVADVLYGVTMGEDGTSKVLSLKLE